MNLIVGNFPLVLLVVVAINGVIARRRVPRYVEARGGGEDGAIRYVWSVSAIVAAYFILLDVPGHLLGANSALCFIPSSHPRSAADYIAWSIWLGFPLALTIWTWFLGGAAILARYSPLYARYFRPEADYGEGIERAFMLFVLAVCIYVPFGARRVRGTLPTCAGAIPSQSSTPAPSATQR